MVADWGSGVCRADGNFAGMPIFSSSACSNARTSWLAAAGFGMEFEIDQGGKRPAPVQWQSPVIETLYSLRRGSR